MAVLLAGSLFAFGFGLKLVPSDWNVDIAVEMRHDLAAVRAAHCKCKCVSGGGGGVGRPLEETQGRIDERIGPVEATGQMGSWTATGGGGRVGYGAKAAWICPSTVGQRTFAVARFTPPSANGSPSSSATRSTNSFVLMAEPIKS